MTAGVYQEDRTVFPDGVEFYPVYFCTEELPFPIAGMSDEMPYESTVYGQMTAEMVRQFKETFAAHIKEAVESFGPDLIICHHLYLLTALVKDMFPRRKVYGFCHNTDLRQMEKTPLERKFIRKQIQKLVQFLLSMKSREKKLSAYMMWTERESELREPDSQQCFLSGTAGKRWEAAPDICRKAVGKKGSY